MSDMNPNPFKECGSFENRLSDVNLLNSGFGELSQYWRERKEDETLVERINVIFEKHTS